MAPCVNQEMQSRFLQPVKRTFTRAWTFQLANKQAGTKSLNPISCRVQTWDSARRDTWFDLHTANQMLRRWNIKQRSGEHGGINAALGRLFQDISVKLEANLVPMNLKKIFSMTERRAESWVLRNPTFSVSLTPLGFSITHQEGVRFSLRHLNITAWGQREERQSETLRLHLYT